MKLFKILRRICIKNLLYWGVKFESELPPEFVIPTHAKERMDQRYFPGMDEEHIKRTVLKAWYEGQGVNRPERYTKGRKGQIPKFYNGKIFVFQVRYNPFWTEISQKTLVTVLDLK